MAGGSFLGLGPTGAGGGEAAAGGSVVVDLTAVCLEIRESSNCHVSAIDALNKRLDLLTAAVCAAADRPAPTINVAAAPAPIEVNVAPAAPTIRVEACVPEIHVATCQPEIRVEACVPEIHVAARAPEIRVEPPQLIAAAQPLPALAVGTAIVWPLVILAVGMAAHVALAAWPLIAPLVNP